MERKHHNKYCFLIIYLLHAEKKKKKVEVCVFFIDIQLVFHELLNFLQKIKGRKRERRDLLYNSHKIFHRLLFFSTIHWCGQQENVYYYVSNYRSTLLQSTISKRQCTFFKSEENYCGHLASKRLRLLSRFYIYLNYFYVCQDKYGLPLYFCLPFTGLYCHSSYFMWKGTCSIFSCSTFCLCIAGCSSHACTLQTLLGRLKGQKHNTGLALDMRVTFHHSISRTVGFSLYW